MHIALNPVKKIMFMNNSGKMTESKNTKQQITKEIAGLRKKIASLEKSETEHMQMEEKLAVLGQLAGSIGHEKPA